MLVQYILLTKSTFLCFVQPLDDIYNIVQRDGSGRNYVNSKGLIKERGAEIF